MFWSSFPQQQRPQQNKSTAPLCTCSSRRPRVTDGRRRHMFVNFPVRASGILNFSHWVATKKNLKSLESLINLPKGFCLTAEQESNLWKAEADILGKKKGMHWTHAFVFFWSLFVEGSYMEEEVVGSEYQPQVISHTHARANTHTLVQSLKAMYNAVRYYFKSRYWFQCQMSNQM